MFRGYRSIITAIAGLAIVAGALFFLIRDLSTVDSAYRHSAANASIKYERDAEAYQKETCISSPTVLADPDCESKADEAKREGQRKEHDLAAQNITAWWTKIMGIAALIGMALSAVGVWLVKTTFDETRKANEIAIFAQRPWISIDATPTIMTTTGTKHSWEYVISFKNLGSTVAKSFSFFHDIVFVLPDFLDACEAQWSEWTPPTNQIRSILMPGDIYNSPGHTSLVDDCIPWIAMGESGPRTVMPVITVTAFYRSDDSDIWHRTDKAFRIGKSGDHWVGAAIDESITRLEPPELIVIPFSASLAT